MGTISIDCDISGMEISTDYQWDLAKIIDDPLQDSGCGRWIGYQCTKDAITIHSVEDDEEQVRSVIRSTVKRHPVFSHNFTKVMIF